MSQSDGAAWFDVMSENCPLLESISLGEGLGISLEQFHYCVCRMVHLKDITLERGNEHLIIPHIESTLKSVKIGPDWMMESDSWYRLSRMHALEYLDIAAGDSPITSDKLLKLEGLEQLKHLHIWPANGPGATRCDVTAIELVLLIKTLPKLADLRLWLEFDFFRHEKAVQIVPHLAGRYPQFDGYGSRSEYLEYLGKIVEAEYESSAN